MKTLMRSPTQNFQSVRHAGLLRTHLDLKDQEMQHLELRPCQGKETATKTTQ